MKAERIFRERKFKAGYIVRDVEVLSHDGDKPEGHTMLMKNQAYNLNGDWIGSSRDAHRLIVTRGIMPELADPGDCVCSIGFCEKDQMWAGWSHRALMSFGIGGRIFEERFGRSFSDKKRDSIPFVKHGYRTIKTLEEAKEAAKNFANYVS